ncbi:MAG: efflux RND transporter permease subunit [Planctomycetes bacterium]|nr:efflux RND transporter permease subunit [Planctomycetota bacterium]
MNLTDLCIRRPVMAWAILLSVVFFGIAGLARIGVSQLPDVDLPYIAIAISWPGASPESVEHDVIDQLEDALAQAEGVTSMTSSSRLGGGSILLELDLRRSADSALQDVQAKISQAQGLLPKDVDPPVVMKLNPEDFPIMWISLSGAVSRRELADATRYLLKERLQQVPGVGDIQVGGNVERNVRLWFDQEKLDAHGLTIVEALSRLRREHLELPAGRLETGAREIDVRVLGEAFDLAALRQVVVGGQPNRPVRLEDVALVEDGFSDTRSISRNNGVDSMAVGVKKQRGENAVAVGSRVRAALTDIQKRLPAGMAVAVNYDQTTFIAKSVRDVQFELLLAMVLTSLVCLLFLGSFAATINVILAIPMSVLGTIAVLHWCGFTLNTFTLLALALVVGIVVDDAIMVQENISRHRDLGLSAPEAARRGTRQIAFAALAATVAVIAIFVPVIFMQGLVGKFFMQFGVALCVAVALSYLEAVTLAPARCAQFLAMTGARKSWLARGSDAGFALIARRYTAVLAAALRRPWMTLLLALAVFLGSFWFVKNLGFEQSPSQDQSSLFVRFETATGSSLEETDRVIRRAEQWLLARLEIERAFTVVGEGFGGGVNAGVMFITLKQPGERALSQEKIGDLMRTEFNSYAGCTAVVQDPSKGGFGGGKGFPVEFSIRGNDWATLTAATRTVMERMRSREAIQVEEFSPAALFGGEPKTKAVIPGDVLVDVDSDYQLGKPQVAIVPDRARAQDLGISVEEVAAAVNALVGGVKVGKFTDGSRRVDVRARLLAQGRQSSEDLANFRIRVPSRDGQPGALVPLSTLVSIESRSVLQTITHKDHSRAISIYANTAEGRTQSEGMTIAKAIAKDLPEGVSLVEQGASAQLKETFTNFLITFVLGLVVAYLILAAQFESFLHPITVLTVLPLAMAGAAAALWLGGFTLNTFSIIGILLLMGIVKKNSIILVDYADKARAEGVDAVEAMARAGAIRLRPILMTSVATMMAAVPTAIGMGAGAETRQPMAVAVFGGVALSTLLSLVVVPAFYVVAERMAARVRSWMPWRARVTP